mgnify:CR=1 FL=1
MELKVHMGEQLLIDDLNQLRVFAEVARAAGITGAAKRLGKPKSTVSRDVARLESSLGTPLLARNGRRVVLTEAGVLFAERAFRILAEIDEATDAVASATETARGVLTVQATYWLGHSLLIPLLPKFLTHFPKIDVVLELKDFANLSTHDWDVQITAGTLADSSFAARRVAEINLRLYASSGYIARCGTPQSFADLIKHEIVDKHWANGTSPWVNFTGMQPAAIKPRLLVNDMIAILHAVREGAGIGWIPSFFAEQAEDVNSLIHILPEFKVEPMPVFAIFPRRRIVSPKVRAFVDFVAESLAIQAPVYRSLVK